MVAREPLGRFRAVGFVMPAMLIGAGITTIGHRSAFRSTDTREELREHFPHFATRADDYLQALPYVGLAAFAFTSPNPRRCMLDNTLLVAKAGTALIITVSVLKKATRIERPDGSSHNSFPSGHTATAFLAATLLDQQLRAKSRWYGVGAYTVAASVGAMRMLNNRHWQSDVLAGAGIGMLTGRLALWQHYRARHPASVRLGARPPAGVWQLAPTVGAGGAPGVLVSWRAVR